MVEKDVRGKGPGEAKMGERGHVYLHGASCDTGYCYHYSNNNNPAFKRTPPRCEGGAQPWRGQIRQGVKPPVRCPSPRELPTAAASTPGALTSPPPPCCGRWAPRWGCARTPWNSPCRATFRRRHPPAARTHNQEAALTRFRAKQSPGGSVGAAVWFRRIHSFTALGFRRLQVPPLPRSASFRVPLLCVGPGCTLEQVVLPPVVGVFFVLGLRRPLSPAGNREKKQQLKRPS